MPIDKLFVIVIGVGLIIFVYWFFLGKSNQDESEDHHH